MQSFEDLDVYKKSREFRKEISELVSRFHKEEKYRLSDQMIRASRSVTAQIAEGFGRYHHQENIQFCRIARGSLSEVHDHLNVAIDENLINVDEHSHLIENKETLMRLINGYINYLRKARNQQQKD